MNIFHLYGEEIGKDDADDEIIGFVAQTAGPSAALSGVIGIGGR